ncbi:MAG: thioesterase family protein [Bacteroidales bacterium]|nr:thioesterase family protein [Bacteroidales bacterium]
MNLQLGIKGEEKEVVRHDNTAAAYGSGLVEVYATPAMIALMEKTCYLSVMPYLDKGEGTVGTHVNVSHKKASPLNTLITCHSEIVEIDRRRIVFKVTAYDDKSDVIGEGTHERFVINTEKFMTK